MSLRQKLTDEMKAAMRARNQVRLDTVRFVLSQIKNAEIDLKHEMSDEEVITLLKKEVKNRKDALSQFVAAGRSDIVADEEAKLAVIAEFLPAEMSDDALRAIVEQVIASSPDRNFGMVMKLVVAAVQGQADGGRISQMVKSLLA